MDDEPQKVDDKEVVGIPEDFKVAPADELHRGGDHKDESQGNDDPCQAGNGGEGHVQRGLRVRNKENQMVSCKV